MVVDAAALNDFRRFSLESIRQIRRKFPSLKEGKWSEEVDKALRAAGFFLRDLRATLDAARESSAAIQGAAQSIDAFVAHAREGSGSSADPEMPGRPFDVRDYGEAAGKIGEAAKGLDELARDVDRSASTVERLIDQAGARGDESIRRASIQFLAVGLVLIGAGAAAAIAVRRFSGRTDRTEEKRI
jgi:hypothetical protein